MRIRSDIWGSVGQQRVNRSDFHQYRIVYFQTRLFRAAGSDWAPRWCARRRDNIHSQMRTAYPAPVAIKPAADSRVNGRRLGGVQPDRGIGPDGGCQIGDLCRRAAGRVDRARWAAWPRRGWQGPRPKRSRSHPERDAVASERRNRTPTRLICHFLVLARTKTE
jgi:hypothetical protein